MSAMASLTSGRGGAGEVRRPWLDGARGFCRRLCLYLYRIGDRVHVDDAHSTSSGSAYFYGDTRGRDCASDFD